MSSSLPSYLTSGASSRNHHALLVALHEARSIQEEQAILVKEVERCKEVLRSKRLSTSKVSESLIILLHTQTFEHTSIDTEWALVHALQLAEAGRTIKERRIGYLYLTEMLPRGHELNLMLINTLRKDVSSTNPHDILLALHTITALPSADLIPAVSPFLTSNELLKHDLASIRQKTVLALTCLFFPSGATPGPFPLSFGKIRRLFAKEPDSATKLALLRLIYHLVTLGESTPEELDGIVEHITQAQSISNQGALLSTEVLKTLEAVRSKAQSASGQSRHNEAISAWIQTSLETVEEDTARGQGDDEAPTLLLEICAYASRHTLPSQVLERCADCVARLLASPAGSSSSHRIKPNDHVLALRCLVLLPLSAWEERFEETEMGVLMEGLNSADPTIRSLTLDLLVAASPQLLAQEFLNYLTSLKTLTNLALPLLPSSTHPDRKLRLAQEETALRALELVEARSKRNIHNPGDEFGQGFRRIMESLHRGLQGQAGQVDKEYIWEVGLRRVLAKVKIAEVKFQRDLVRSLIETSGERNRGTSPTLGILRATLWTGYQALLPAGTSAPVDDLLDRIEKWGPSVQELLLVAALHLITRMGQLQKDDCLSKLKEKLTKLASKGGRALAQRCTQIEYLIEHELLDEVSAKATSSSLADTLGAIIQVYDTHNLASEGSTPTKAAGGSTNTKAPRHEGLRYDAYDPPATSSAARAEPRRGLDSTSSSRVVSRQLLYSPSSSASGRHSANSSRGVSPRRGMNETMSAGEFALLSADGEAVTDTLQIQLDETSATLTRLSVKSRNRSPV